AGVSGGDAVGQPGGNGRGDRDVAGAARPPAVREARKARAEAGGRAGQGGERRGGAALRQPRRQHVGAVLHGGGSGGGGKRPDTARFGRFFWAMMDRGVYLPCSQFEAAFNSVAHTEKHIEQTVTAAREALAEIK